MWLLLLLFTIVGFWLWYQCFFISVHVQSHQQQPDASFGLARPRWGAWAMPAPCQLELRHEILMSWFNPESYTNWQECRHREPSWIGVDTFSHEQTLIHSTNLGFAWGFFMWWKTKKLKGLADECTRALFCHWWWWKRIIGVGYVCAQSNWRYIPFVALLCCYLTLAFRPGSVFCYKIN
jgi:hypothetical protein